VAVNHSQGRRKLTGYRCLCASTKITEDLGIRLRNDTNAYSQGVECGIIWASSSLLRKPLPRGIKQSNVWKGFYMALNKKLLADKKRLLCGESRTIEWRGIKDDMDVVLSLTLRGKSVNTGSILAEEMRWRLDTMDRNSQLYPYAVAVYQMYSDKYDL
jgi:hypothetical protein